MFPHVFGFMPGQPDGIVPAPTDRDLLVCDHDDNDNHDDNHDGNSNSPS